MRLAGHIFRMPDNTQVEAEIMETTLVVSRFCFLRVESHISELRVIILPGMQILKVRSRISPDQERLGTKRNDFQEIILLGTSIEIVFQIY